MARARCAPSKPVCQQKGLSLFTGHSPRAIRLNERRFLRAICFANRSWTGFRARLRSCGCQEHDANLPALPVFSVWPQPGKVLDIFSKLNERMGGARLHSSWHCLWLCGAGGRLWQRRYGANQPGEQAAFAPLSAARAWPYGNRITPLRINPKRMCGRKKSIFSLRSVAHKQSFRPTLKGNQKFAR